MFTTQPNTAASFYPPNIICATCKRESSRNNFVYTVGCGAHEVCTSCRQELKEAKDGE